jgi:sec-independent protein translocase protein TatA
MFNIGPTELIVIVIIALIVFGPRRLPEIGRTVGKSMREFRQASQDLKNEFNFNLDDDLPGDRPAPGEPGYAHWQAGEQPASANGGSESSNGSAANSATGALTAGVGLGVVAGSGGEPKVEPSGEPVPAPDSAPDSAPGDSSAEPAPADEVDAAPVTAGAGWTRQVWKASLASVDVQPDAAGDPGADGDRSLDHPAGRDDAGTEAAG